MRLPVVTVLALAVLTGCSGDDGGGSGGSSSDFLGDLGDPAPIQFRLVTEADVPDVDCTAPSPTPADRPASGCDPSGRAYRLDPAAFETTASSAASGLDATTGGAVVTVTLPDDVTEDLAVLSTQYAGGSQQVAIYVEGRVVSAPVFATPVDDGVLQVTGGDLTPPVADGIVAALT